MNRLAKTIEDLGLDPTQPYTIQFLEEKLKEREEKLKTPEAEQEAALEVPEVTPEEAVKLSEEEPATTEDTPVASDVETAEAPSEEKSSPKKSGRPKKSA